MRFPTIHTRWHTRLPYKTKKPIDRQKKKGKNPRKRGWGEIRTSNRKISPNRPPRSKTKTSKFNYSGGAATTFALCVKSAAPPLSNFFFLLSGCFPKGQNEKLTEKIDYRNNSSLFRLLWLVGWLVVLSIQRHYGLEIGISRQNANNFGFRKLFV